MGWCPLSKPDRRIHVYVAGPFNGGDVAQNITRAIEQADRLWRKGYMPYVPHLTFFWHMICPHDHEEWIDLDRAWLAKCDVMLRMPGRSVGADKDEEIAKGLGIRTVHSEKDLDVCAQRMCQMGYFVETRTRVNDGNF